MDSTTSLILYVIVIIIAVIFLWCLWGYQHWKVWSAHQSGLADLTKAKNEQQIQIAQAQSRLDAAELNKQAAVIEAEAVALQIQEIGETLTDHSLYLKWQWIQMMEKHSHDSIIYVATESGLPILEANRLRQDVSAASPKPSTGAK